MLAASWQKHLVLTNISINRQYFVSLLSRGCFLLLLRHQFLTRFICFLCAPVWICVTGSAPVAAQMSASALPVSAASATSSAVPLTVRGQVISATTGMPIFRALVRLNDRNVLTDHEGKFEFRDFSATQMNNLQASKPGFYGTADSLEPGTLNLRSEQLAQSIEVRLYPEALLTGTVTRPDGTPLPHISVTARRSAYNDQIHRWIPSGQTMTDSHGNFRIPVPPGDYKIETGYSPHEGGTSEGVLPVMFPSTNDSSTSGLLHVVSGAHEHFELRPQLSRTYGVNLVIDSSEGGFPMITARSKSGLTIPAHQSGHPTGPGQMRLELPSGSFTLIATQNTQDTTLYGEATVNVPDHDVDGIVLRLAYVTPIPVEMIVDSDATSDKTLPNVQQFGLMLESTQDSTQPEGTMVGLMPAREGSASFRAMPGTYRLQARGSANAWYIKGASYGTADLLDRDLTVSAGASGDAIRLTVSDQTGSLKGSTSLNGVMASCWFYLIPTGPSAMGVFSSRSNSDGSFSFAYLPPGSYRAIAFEQRYSTNYRDPMALDKFVTHVGTVSISAGNKASLDLDAVSVKEMTQ